MTKPVDRRTVLRHMTTTAVLVEVGALAGCGNDADGLPDGSTFADLGGSQDLGSSVDAQADAGSADLGEPDTGVTEDAGEDDIGVADTGGASPWATGGTAAMSGNYRDPFAAGLGAACSLTCEAALGPCYVGTEVRKDISEGQLGLPVRFAFIVVDENCDPVEGAEVDIWHTSATGFYSGMDAPDLCTLGDANARASRWHRGIQVTDVGGRADFDSCFPGWYGGRTIHIHLTVRVQGQEYLTSQLYFDDALSDEIIDGQPVYRDRGARDTDNAQDGLFPRVDSENYIFETERQADGAMLAYKALVIRSSLRDPQC